MASEEFGPADQLIGYYDCDECGFTFRKRQLLRRYDGALVCRWCYEEKHPRDEMEEVRQVGKRLRFNS